MDKPFVAKPKSQEQTEMAARHNAIMFAIDMHKADREVDVIATAKEIYQFITGASGDAKKEASNTSE